MKPTALMVAISCLAVSALAASGTRSASPADARLYFIAPQGGELVTGELPIDEYGELVS